MLVLSDFYSAMMPVDMLPDQVVYEQSVFVINGWEIQSSSDQSWFVLKKQTAIFMVREDQENANCAQLLEETYNISFM